MTFWLWAGFVLFILVMLALDLGLVNRHAHVVSAREALAWTAICIALALAFNVVVYFMYRGDWLGIGVTPRHNVSGVEAAGEFFTGWLVEYSLSLDNIFVIALVFRRFRVPQSQQHRVLFWGVLGALIMRGGMIGAGAALVHRFSWVEYLMGAFLVATAARMLLEGDDEPHPERGLAVRVARRLLPMSAGYEGSRFFTRVAGRRVMTPLFLVLLVVETTDVVFAVDSIPAIFGITHDAFLIFTSNVFAILGLRSLYFALAAVMDKFRYLKVSLVFVLAFVGLKMVLRFWFDTPTWVSLAVIVLILGAGVAASAVRTRREHRARPAPIDDLAGAAELAWKRSRRVVILVVGLTIIFIIAPLTGVLPGPGGIPVAIAGLALLATEFVWARRLLDSTKKRALAVAARVDVLIGERPRLWPVPLVISGFLGAVGVLIAYEPRWVWTVLLASSGPGIAIGYWAMLTVRKWRALRVAASRAADTSGAPPSGRAEPDPREDRGV